MIVLRWVLLLCLGMQALASAAPLGLVSWQSNVPSGLAPFAGNKQVLLDLLGPAKGQMLYYPQPASTTPLLVGNTVQQYKHHHYVTGAILLPKPEAQVRALLTRHSAYPATFKLLKSAHTQVQLADSQLMRYHIFLSLPFPMPDVDEVAFMQHDPVQPFNDGFKMRSTLRKGAIHIGVGEFEWYSIDDNTTLLMLTQMADLDRPSGFFVTTIFNAMPEIKTAIPYGLEAYILESVRVSNQLPNPGMAQAWPAVLPNINIQLASTQQLAELAKPTRYHHSGVVQLTHLPVMLKSGSVTFAKQTNNKAKELRFVTSIFTLPVGVERITNVLLQGTEFKKIFRHIRSVKTKVIKPGHVQHSVILRVGVGFFSVGFESVIDIQQQDDRSILIRAVDGDVEWILGKMQLLPMGNSTVVVWTQAGDIGDNAPALLKIGRHLPHYQLLSVVGAGPLVAKEFNRYWQMTNKVQNP